MQFKGCVNADYPAQESLQLTSEISAALSSGVCQRLDEIVAAEVRATAKG